MSTSDASLVASWNNASTIILRYSSIIIYLFGFIGNLLNILVLSQRNIRSNPSAILLLLSSVAGTIAIVSGLTSRIVTNFTTDVSEGVDWLCKLRNVILYSSRTLVLCTIVIATIDRWLSSSASTHRRQMSSMKTAQKSMAIALLYTCIINAPIIYCYESNQIGTFLACYGSSYQCRIATDLIYAIGSILIPLVAMTIFSLLIVRNVRQTMGRVQNSNTVSSTVDKKAAPQVNHALHRRKKVDRQILVMLLVQVTLLFLLTSPVGVQKVYSSITTVPSRRTLSGAIQNCLFNIFTCLSFTASAMPFYIYTLSGGSVFRNAFFDLMKNAHHKISIRCTSVI